MELVYASHVMEHLDTPTVCRVLLETRRVLRPNGYFLARLPDFDQALACWRGGDSSFMAGNWDFESILHTWPHRGINDTLDNRTAMLFCGFWNESYGDHYAGRISDNPAAYHGPAVVPIDVLRKLLSSCSPSRVSAELRKWVLERETDKIEFNHQNAWSREELKLMLEQSGFEVITFESDRIIRLFPDVPGIDSMAEQSMYCLAAIGLGTLPNSVQIIGRL